MTSATPLPGCAEIDLFSLMRVVLVPALKRSRGQR